MKITVEELQKKFESLPDDLKWAIMAANVDDNIIAIGKEQNLNVEQMGQLSLETHMVMFGYTDPDKFEESVQASLQLPKEKTRAVADAVNEKILKEIREKMKEAFREPAAPSVLDNLQKKSDNLSAKKDADILSSAGITIVPKKEEQGTNSVLAQKMSGPVQVPTAKTEYTPETKPGIPAAVENTKPNPRKIDPYREIPE